MSASDASRTPRFVIVVPPTDHYRMYEIVGHVETFKSEPLSFGAPQNSTPCGPQCPATQYQQLPKTSGVVQHYPPLPPQKPVQKVLETTQKSVDVVECRRNTEQISSGVSSKLTGKNQLSSKSIVNKPKKPKTLDLTPVRKVAVSTSDPTKGLKTLKFFEGCVVVKKLDIPNDYETIRIAPRDKRIKDDHNARVVVDTREGGRHVTLLRGYENEDDNVEVATSLSQHGQATSTDVWSTETSSMEQVWPAEPSKLHVNWSEASLERLWPSGAAGAEGHEVTTREQLWAPSAESFDQDWSVDTGNFQPIWPMRVPDSGGVSSKQNDAFSSEYEANVQICPTAANSLHDVLDFAGFEDEQGHGKSDFGDIEQAECDPNVMFYPVFGFDQMQWSHDQQNTNMKHNNLIWRPTAPIPAATLGLPMSPVASSRLNATRKPTAISKKLHLKRKVVGEHPVSRRCKVPVQRSSIQHVRNKFKIQSVAKHQRVMLAESPATPSGLNVWRSSKSSKSTGVSNAKSGLARHPSAKAAARTVQNCRKQNIPSPLVRLPEPQPAVDTSNSSDTDCSYQNVAVTGDFETYCSSNGSVPGSQTSVETTTISFGEDPFEKSATIDDVAYPTWCREPSDSLQLENEQSDDSASRQSSIFKSADDEADVKRSSRRNAKRPAHLTDFYMDIPAARKAN